MLYYIIFGIILATILLSLFLEFIHESHKKFKKKIKFILSIILVIIILLIMTRFPNIISVIPAVFLILYRWRVFINFLLQTFFFKKRNNSSKSLKKEDAYEILGLKQNASKNEILKRYQELIKKNHPDKGGSEWITKQINKARDTLLS